MASFYARELPAVGFRFSCLQQFSPAGERFGVSVRSRSATGDNNTKRNELLAIPLPCSQSSTEPRRKRSWMGYHKCANLGAFSEYTFLR